MVKVISTCYLILFLPCRVQIVQAIGKSNAGCSNTLTGVFDIAEDESDTCFELSSDSDKDEDNTKGDVKSEKKAALMKMKFSQEDIDLAISRLGSDASVAELIDCIIAAQIAGSVKGNIGSSTGAADEIIEVVSTEALFTTMDKTLQLLQMGFTEEEISTVMDNHDAGASVCELADLIFASRIAHGYIKKEKDSFMCKEDNIWDDQDRSWNQGQETANLPKSEFSTSGLGGSSASNSNNIRGDLKEISKRKRSTWTFNKASFSSSNRIKTDYENEAEAHVPYSRNYRHRPSKPPFYFFGNVIDISHETWMKLCSFLDATEPEVVNSQFFSAFIRKEGYIHNLPIENRSYILPRPSMTIEAALPHTKRWWPSWDTRKKLSCLASETQGVDSLCERLGRMMASSRGILSKVQQTDILHQCRTMNLLWVAENKLRPVEANEVEQILGYPPQHTGDAGLNESNRMRALKHAFQVDTLGYYLSSLKCLYPEGIRVISVFTGIGGAELALSGLGIHLQCVISIEGSEVNRRILKRWWQESGQTGELRQIERTQKLSGEMIENIIEEFGDIDLVIAGNPSSFGSPLGHDTNGVDIQLFYEFVRIFQRVKGATRRRSKEKYSS